jgi:hypothetical protein
MLFSALILVSVYGEHDSLQKRIYLGHGDEPAEVGNVAWFGLEEKKEVAVLLRFFIVWEEAFGDVGGVFQVTSDFFALRRTLAFSIPVHSRAGQQGYLFKSHAILNQQGYP